MLPQQPGCYLYLDPSGKVIYVGKAKNLRSRVRSYFGKHADQKSRLLVRAAILGVHSIKRRPVVLDDDSIVARSMLYLSLSFDHRLVDGAEGAMFTGRVIELLETPEEIFLDL